MNKIILLGAAAVALTLAGTAASAQPYGYYGGGYYGGGGYERGYVRDSDRDGIPDRAEWNRDRDRDGRPDQYDRHDNRRDRHRHYRGNHHNYHNYGNGYGPRYHDEGYRDRTVVYSYRNW